MCQILQLQVDQKLVTICREWSGVGGIKTPTLTLHQPQVSLGSAVTIKRGCDTAEANLKVGMNKRKQDKTKTNNSLT